MMTHCFIHSRVRLDAETEYTVTVATSRARGSTVLREVAVIAGG